MLFVLLALGLNLVGAEFTPSCSFSGGQCQYTVQLGHQGQCDKTTSSSVDQTLMRNELNQLQTTVASLSNQLQTLQNNQINTTNATNSDKRLQALELEFIHTKQILLDATNQIQTLRTKLGTTTRGLNTCRGVLGLQTNNVTTVQPITDGNLNVTFCDFQSTDRFCGFPETGSGTGFYWKPHSNDVNLLTGPKEDHTYGSPHGRYMYMDARSHPSNRKGNHTYTMTSYAFQPSPAACIRLWYNMNGNDIRTLNVYAKIGSGNGYPIWSLSGNHGQGWHLAEVNLDSEYTSSSYQIVIEGITDSYEITWPSHTYYNKYGDIAVDDVYVYNTSCTNVPSCPSGSIKTSYQNVTSCYTFHVTPMTWYEAAESCRLEGANSALVSITTAEEQKFLVDHINGDLALKSVSNGYYTSGNDERSEGTFDWTDTGTPYTSKYTDWHGGQPNNVANDQNCLLLQYGSEDYQWGDISCSTKHPFICETRLPKGMI